MAHRTFIVEETDQPKAVLTHDVIEGTVTSVDATAKTLSVDLDQPYKPRSLSTDFGKVQQKGYDGLPSTPEVTQLTDVEIVYNCETAPENPAGAFTVGLKCLILAIGTDYFAVGFPDEVKTCVTDIYLRATIDSKALPYGGQSFSISYKKEGEITFTDTAQKPIWGTWGTVDPKLHGIAGPFSLEDWDRISAVRVNLHKARDVAAWRGNTVSDKNDFFAAVVVAPVNGVDPPWGAGLDGETDVWNGQRSMFHYCIDDVGGSFFDYLMNNTGISPLGELLPLTTSCTAGLCPRTGAVLGQARVRASILGFTDSLPPPSFVGETNTVSTNKYRVAERIYIEVAANDVIDNLVTQDVFNRDTMEEEQGLVLERNFAYGLKQRRLIFKTWAYKANIYTFIPAVQTGYGRQNEILWHRITATSWTNTNQVTFAMLSFQAAGAPGWSMDALSPAGCRTSWGEHWYGAVDTRDSILNGQMTLTDFIGFPTLTLQQAIIKIDDEGAPTTQSFPAAAVHHLTQPRDAPELGATGCTVHTPLTHKYEASIVAMNDRWY